MKLILFLLLSMSLFGSVEKVKPAVNKTQLCSVYEEAFINSAELYEDTKSCYDLKYSILSFKQMILTECEMDPEYVGVIWYLQNQYNENCNE